MSKTDVLNMYSGGCDVEERSLSDIVENSGADPMSVISSLLETPHYVDEEVA